MIKEVDLDDKHVGTNLAYGVALSILKKGTKNVKLNLKNNELGDNDAKAIVQMLAHNDTINFLELSKCKIGDEGA